MMIEKIKKGNYYHIEWVDGEVLTTCLFVQTHRNFLIFLDKSGMKIVCRPESIRRVTEVVNK